MVSAGVVAAGETLPGAVAVDGAIVAFARTTARVAVESTFTLVTLTTIRIGHTRALASEQVAECIMGTETVAFAHYTQTDRQSISLRFIQRRF